MFELSGTVMELLTIVDRLHYFPVGDMNVKVSLDVPKDYDVSVGDFHALKMKLISGLYDKSGELATLRVELQQVAGLV